MFWSVAVHYSKEKSAGNIKFVHISKFHNLSSFIKQKFYNHQPSTGPANCECSCSVWIYVTMLYKQFILCTVVELLLCSYRLMTCQLVVSGKMIQQRQRPALQKQYNSWVTLQYKACSVKLSFRYVSWQCLLILRLISKIVRLNNIHVES